MALLQEKHEICCGLFHGFDWAVWKTGTPAQKLGLLPPAQEHILAQEEGKDRLLRVVTELSQAFALAVPHAVAMGMRDDVAFFQAVRAALAKGAATHGGMLNSTMQSSNWYPRLLRPARCWTSSPPPG